MQCPSCDHVAPQSAFGEPLRCPDCGAFYEKALELKLRQKQAPTPTPTPTPTVINAAVPVPPQKGLVPCRGCRAMISKHATSCPRCGAVAKKRTSAFTWIVAVLAVIWLIGFISTGANSPAGTGFPSGKPATSSVAAPEARLSALDQARESTKLVSFEGQKSAGGALLKVTFVVRNSGSVPVKDIEMECTHFGPSGTRIDSNTRTIYEIVEAGKTRTFRNFDMGFIHSQAASTNCVIKSLKI